MGISPKLTTDEYHETPHIQNETPANTIGHEATWVTPTGCTIRQLSLWVVPESEDTLQLRSVTQHIRSNLDGPEPIENTDIPSYDDDEQLVTDESNDSCCRISAGMRGDDRIVIIANNKGTDYTYRFHAPPTVNYLGGIRRVIGGVF